MATLPANIVSRPEFDSPLRRTTAAPELSPPTPTQMKPAAPTLVEATAAKAKRKNVASSAPKRAGEATVTSLPTPEEVLSERFSLHLTAGQQLALDTHVFKRRQAGDKTNAGILMREILDAWIAQAQ